MAEQKAATFSTPYQFNAKELDSETGLYNYGARYYDPKLSLWTGVDPLADHPNQADKSPYSYAWDNPVNLTDPDGRCPFCPLIYAFAVGFGVGASADATVQIATNKVQGKGAFENYSVSSTLISGTFAGFSGGQGGIIRTGLIAASESAAKQIISDDAVVDAVAGDFSAIKENASNISLTTMASDVAMDRIGGNAKAVGDAKIKVKERHLDRTTRISNNDPSSSGRAATQRSAQSSLNNANNLNDYLGSTAGKVLQDISNGTREAFSNDYKFLPSGTFQPMVQDNTQVNNILEIPR